MRAALAFVLSLDRADFVSSTCLDSDFATYLREQMRETILLSRQKVIEPEEVKTVSGEDDVECNADAIEDPREEERAMRERAREEL